MENRLWFPEVKARAYRYNGVGLKDPSGVQVGILMLEASGGTGRYLDVMLVL